MSAEEVERRYNEVAKSTQVGAGYYLEELVRRRNDRRETLLVRLTIATTILAGASVAVAVVAVIVAA